MRINVMTCHGTKVVFVVFVIVSSLIFTNFSKCFSLCCQLFMFRLKMANEVLTRDKGKLEDDLKSLKMEFETLKKRAADMDRDNRDIHLILSYLILRLHLVQFRGTFGSILHQN